MDSLGVRLRAAREALHWSREGLSHATGRVGGRPYVSAPTIEAIEMGKTARPDDQTILRLGEALPDAGALLPNYRLALARRTLDEWQVGEHQALANLAAVEKLLTLAGEATPQAARARGVRLLRGAAPRPSAPKRTPKRRGKGAAKGSG